MPKISPNTTKFDDPDNDIYYCRFVTKAKRKKRYVNLYCERRMTVVPSFKRGKQFFAWYMYCPKHNVKHLLGY